MTNSFPVDRQETDSGFSRLFDELRQWHVFRIAVAYAVVAWLLVQVVATVGPAFDLPNWVLRSIVLAAIVGFLATMSFLLFRPRSAGKGRLPVYLSRRSRLVAGAGVLLVAAAAAALSIRSLSARDEVALAVLPFADLSPGGDKAYFAEGIAEEILSTLATENDIKVLGRTSARQIEHNPDPKQVRASLGITHLLEGSARTAGDQMRVNVRLIETATGTSVWEEEYQGRLADIFTVQDQIAASVVRRLHGTFARRGNLPETPSTKINVYQSYLAARALMRDRTEPTLRQAFGLAQQVVKADPIYAPGQALYTELVWMLSDDPDAYGTIPAATAARIGEQHARTAIRLAPDQADGYAALGLVGNDSAAIPALKRAIALDPSRTDVRIWLATRLTKAGRYDEALALSREAAAIEPLWQMPIFDLVVRLTVNGQVTEARQVAEQYRARGGNKDQYKRLLFSIKSRGPDISAAIVKGEEALALDSTLPNIRGSLTSLYYLVRLEERAPKDSPSAGRLSGPFFRRDTSALETQIRNSGKQLWHLPDSSIGFSYLASVQDWRTLNRLYDDRPMPARRLCFHNLDAAQAMVPALRAAGRRRDADSVLSCLRDRLAIEGRQKARSWYAYDGDFEFDQATLAALTGDTSGALSWLKRAVARGWLGRPYSSKLADRPQFAPLAATPEFGALQAGIDRRISQERREILGQRQVQRPSRG